MAVTPINLSVTNITSTSVRLNWVQWTPAQLFLASEEGAWYDPSDLSTLFQDAAGTIPVTADGDPVGKMLDKSGNGNHASQSVSGNRPVYRTDGVLHWLEFDGIDDFFETVTTLQVKSLSFAVDVNSSDNLPIIRSDNTDYIFLRSVGDTYTASVDGTGANSGAIAVNGGDYYPANFTGKNIVYPGSTNFPLAPAVASVTHQPIVSYTDLKIGVSAFFYFSGKIFGLVIRDEAIVNQSKSDTEDYLASLAGVTL